MKRIVSRLRGTGQKYIFHDYKTDMRVLAEVINNLTDKINELVDEVNRIKEIPHDPT